MALIRSPDDPYDRHFKPGMELAWLRERGWVDDQAKASKPLWVFGYGSLMWNPGFAHDRAEPALLRGYHRRFCVSSYRYRGTPDYPGLVLGLDRGGACWGKAFRVPADDVAEAAEYLWYREMISAVYAPHLVPLPIGDDRVQAVTFVVQREHKQYYPGHDLDAAAEIIAKAVGPRGPNEDYLTQTVAHLQELNIRDPQMEKLERLVLAKKR